MTWHQLPAIWALRGLSATEKLVLLALAQFADKQGTNARPAQSTVAEMCGITDRTVRRCLTVLVTKGHITPYGKGRKGTVRFRINADKTAFNPKQSLPPMSTPSGHRSPTIHLTNPSNKDSNVLPKQTGIQSIDKFSNLRQRNEPGYVTLARLDKQRGAKR
tara:strand:- start:203 stop:685 length:483 start_codon:yes stop_codon:yes gene_type:complete